MCFGVLCRIIYPPIYPSGVSDIFPSPGAGMYPTRYFSFTNLCWSLPTFLVVAFLILFICKFLLIVFRPGFGTGGGSMHLGSYNEAFFSCPILPPPPPFHLLAEFVAFLYLFKILLSCGSRT